MIQSVNRVRHFPCCPIHAKKLKHHVFYMVWLFDLLKKISQREGSPPLLAMLQRILQLGSTALPLVATKNNRKELRGVRPPPLFHAKNVWNVVFDMVYGLMVSCHAMLKIIRLHYPKVTLHYVIMLPLVTSSPVPTIPSQFPSYFFLALPHQFGNFAEIGFEPSSYQSHLTHFFPAPVWVTLPTLVLSQLHYIPSSPFFESWEVKVLSHFEPTCSWAKCVLQSWVGRYIGMAAALAVGSKVR